jgi:hypothetical protein
MITWQVGHLLVDTLELLYSSMVRQYGDVNPASVFIIDVAGRAERSDLQDMILSSVYASDTPFKMLKYFTHNSIHTADAFASMVHSHLQFSDNQQLCFTDLHLGLDASTGYIFDGQLHHPGNVDTFRHPRDHRAQIRYQHFQAYLHRKLGSHSSEHRGCAGNQCTGGMKVLFIKRISKRPLRNFARLHATANAEVSKAIPGSTVATIILEQEPFANQILALAEADLVVAQYGTGAHNVVFMHAGSILLLLMPQGWCRWKWVYVNQAILAGVHAQVYCDEGADPYCQVECAVQLAASSSRAPSCTTCGKPSSPFRLRWARQSWTQPPWHEQYSPQEVAEPTFSKLVLQCIDVFVQHKEQYSAQQRVHARLQNTVFRDISLCNRTNCNGAQVVRAGAGVHAAVILVSAAEQRDSNGRWMVKLGLEALFNADANLGQEPYYTMLDYMAAHHSHLKLCLQIHVAGLADDSSTQPFCWPCRALNRFSTIDMQLEPSDIVVHSWLESIAGAAGEQYTQVTGSAGFLPLAVELGFIAAPSSPLATWPPLHPLGDKRTLAVFAEGEPVLLTFMLDSTEIIIIVHPNDGDGAVLQGEIATVCSVNHLETAACLVLARWIHNQLIRVRTARVLGLPPRQFSPSEVAPFVFLHLEKCAGSSLRRYIAQAAVAKQLPFLIPGRSSTGERLGARDPAHTMQFDLSQVQTSERENLAILGGHFQWGVWEELPSSLQSPKTVTPSELKFVEHPGFSCLVFLREPAARVISMYYERIYPLNGQIKLSELSLSVLEGYLQNWYGSAFGKWRDEGLSNAACKMLCGANTHKGKGTDATFGGDIERVDLSFDIAKQNMAKCAVGLQDSWEDSKLIIWHWFPWLRFEDDQMMNTGMGSAAEKPSDLPKAILEMIFKYNTMDRELYEEAKRLFQLQLKVMQADVL